MSGSLPDRIYVIGLDSSGEDSFCRTLAEAADQNLNGSTYDDRVTARDTLGRPLWAKGAFVLVGSAEAQCLHEALEKLSIRLDSRYLVLAEDCATGAFESMAHRSQKAGSNQVICTRKAFVKKMRSITVDPDDLGEHEEFVMRQRHRIFQELFQHDPKNLPEDADIEKLLRKNESLH